MKVIADVALVPIGIGVSVSREIAACQKILRDSRMKAASGRLLSQPVATAFITSHWST